MPVLGAKSIQADGGILIGEQNNHLPDGSEENFASL